jgi:hypothetical protein
MDEVFGKGTSAHRAATSTTTSDNAYKITKCGWST